MPRREQEAGPASDATDRSRRSWVGFGPVSGLLALLVVALSVHDRKLAAKVRELTYQLRRAQLRPLGRGGVLPAVVLLDSRGRSTPVAARPGEHGVLLLVSALGCGACDEVRLEWSRAADAASRLGVRVMELILDADREALGRDPGRDPWVPAFLPGPGSEAITRNLPAVPAALVIDANGVVQRAVYGSPHEELAAAVEGLCASGVSNSTAGADPEAVER